MGKAICQALAATGIPVIINFQSNEQADNEVKTEVEALGDKAELMRFDVSKAAEVEAALDAWQDAHPDDYIAYLVNNAGIRRDNVMFMMPDEDWHAVINTSLDGFFYVTRKLLPKMMMLPMSSAMRTTFSSASKFMTSVFFTRIYCDVGE